MFLRRNTQKKLSIGAFTKGKKKEKEKKKDNQYKLNKAMAIAIGLIYTRIPLSIQTIFYPLKWLRLVLDFQQDC